MPKFHKAKETDSIFCDGSRLDSKETDTWYRKLTVTFSGCHSFPGFDEPPGEGLSLRNISNVITVTAEMPETMEFVLNGKAIQ